MLVHYFSVISFACQYCELHQIMSLEINITQTTEMEKSYYIKTLFWLFYVMNLSPKTISSVIVISA